MNKKVQFLLNIEKNAKYEVNKLNNIISEINTRSSELKSIDISNYEESLVSHNFKNLENKILPN